MRKSSKKGFTLIEVMVTVGLLALVGGLCISLIFLGINHSRQNAERSAFQIGVNKFIAILNEQINSGGNGQVSVEYDDEDNAWVEVTVQLDSKNTKVETYTFNFGGSEPKSGTITMSNGHVIAPYIKDAEFSYNETTRLLNIKVQSALDDGWLETSFYIR